MSNVGKYVVQIMSSVYDSNSKPEFVDRKVCKSLFDAEKWLTKNVALGAQYRIVKVVSEVFRATLMCGGVEIKGFGDSGDEFRSDPPDANDERTVDESQSDNARVRLAVELALSNLSFVKNHPYADSIISETKGILRGALDGLTAMDHETE